MVSIKAVLQFFVSWDKITITLTPVCLQLKTRDVCEFDCDNPPLYPPIQGIYIVSVSALCSSSCSTSYSSSIVSLLTLIFAHDASVRFW